MGREVIIPWIRRSNYHRLVVQYTMGRGFKIPWIGNLDFIEHYERSGQQYWLRWAFSFRIQVIVIYQLHWFWPFTITFRIPFSLFWHIFFLSDLYISMYIYIYILATRKESSSGLLFFRPLVLSVLHWFTTSILFTLKFGIFNLFYYKPRGRVVCS